VQLLETWAKRNLDRKALEKKFGDSLIHVHKCKAATRSIATSRLFSCCSCIGLASFQLQGPKKYGEMMQMMLIMMMQMMLIIMAATPLLLSLCVALSSWPFLSDF